jgi:hypothetical protein
MSTGVLFRAAARANYGILELSFYEHSRFNQPATEYKEKRKCD